MEHLLLGGMREPGTTASGIRVVVYPSPGRPIAMTAAFNAGRRYDPLGLECLAHVGEHMIVAGTSDLPRKDMVAAYIERLGGTIGATTMLSTLLIKLTIGQVTDLDKAVYLLNQLLVHSHYDATVLEKERGSVHQELAALKADPKRYVERLFRAYTLSDSSLRDKTMDNEMAIDRVTIENVRDFAAQRLTGSNLVIVLAGGITLEEALRSLDQGLELGNNGQVPLLDELSWHQQPPQDRIVSKVHTSNQVQLAYGFLGRELGHPANPALDVLTTIIGGGRASSLSRRLRYDKGLVYSVRAENANELGCGLWGIVTATDPAKLPTVLGIINDELARATDGGLTETEVCLAKDTLVNSARLRYDPLPDFMAKQVESDLYELHDETRIPGRFSAVTQVTRADVTAVAQRLFCEGQSRLALCGAQPKEVDALPLY